MKTEYKVLHDWTTVGLSSLVHNHISQGWELQGGVSIAYSPGGSLYYAQAMVKKTLDKAAKT